VKFKNLSLVLTASIILSSTFSCASVTKGAVESDQKQTKVLKENKNKTLLNYEKFELENGLKVFLAKNTESPRFTAHIAVNAGSKLDPADATGIAHYLEHMLFKGTEKIGTSDYAKEKVLLDKVNELYDKRFIEKDEKKREQLNKEINKLTVEASKYAIPNEIDSVYSKLGGNGLNAYTTPEETVYTVDLPKNRMEQWAKVESERFLRPVFRLFQPELETVYEEKNISLDNKSRILSEAVESTLYKVHPYGTQTTLGSVEHLKNPSLTKMYEFYNKYYVPNNMAIVISGDIDIAQTKELITKYFSSWKKREVPKFEPPQEKPLNGVEKVEVNYKAEEQGILAFRTVPFNHPDKPVLTLIDMMLDNGDAGLINLDLVNTEKVRAAGSYPYFNEDYGTQYLYVIPREGQTLEEGSKLLLAQLDKLKKGEFDESLLSGIILSFEKGKKGSLESNEGRVDIMKDAFLRETTVEDIMSFSDKLKKINKQDIINAANKYFGNNYVWAVRRDKEQTLPKIEKPKLEKISLNQGKTSEFIETVKNIKSEPIQPKWVDYKKDFKVKSYAPGTVLYHVNNPLNDLFGLSIVYDYGSKHDRDFCYVMNELNYAGTDDMSPDQVKKELFKMGVDISYGCSDYGFSMSVSGVDSQLEKGLALGEKILWNAKIDQSRFDESIKNAIKSREDQKNDVNTLRSALNSYISVDKESGFLDRHSKEELKKISLNQYPQMKNTLRKQNFKIYYSGQSDIDTVESVVKKYHSPSDITVPLLNPRKDPPFKLVNRHNKPVKIYFLDHKGAQSHIGLIVQGDEVNPKERLMTSVYNEFFDGGMGAILFQEVRESRALAYSTSARYYTGGRLGDQDQMGGYIGTQADKTVEALKLFIDLLKNPPESMSHFETAKSAIENSYRTGYINFRGVIGSVNRWAELGYDYDPRKDNFELLSSIQFSQLKDFIKNKISSRNLTFTIVGDKSKIDMKALAKLGEIEEVKKEKLFKD
jgi:predicted Zn-dependent peptidase